MIAVMLPSRGRPELLERSVKSLRDLAASSDTYRIRIAADDDDSVTIDKSRELDLEPLIVKRMGYSRLNEYYNRLTEEPAKWYMLWNDDAIMQTVGWDLMILNARPGILIADLESQHTSHGLVCFPAVREAAVRAVGGFSPHTCHCDTYWQDIGIATGTLGRVGVKLLHDRYDLTGNNRDATWQESQSNYRTGEYYSRDIQSKIAQDTETIRRLSWQTSF